MQKQRARAIALTLAQEQACFRLRLLAISGFAVLALLCLSM
ncbi:hypothetical protein ACFOVS_12540 [Rhizobium lemnae]|uniref:Uncharacterized protein n=1 Tax=Rhizobium lemnae TaxID=1214924 RepID=A0ABV8EAL0_9HYPH|nr:hypothetical protein [Rhizobium lemnae]